MNPILEQLSATVIAGRSKDAKAATQQALGAGIPLQEIVDNALVAAMGVVGDKFKRNEISVPNMLVAARAMKESMLLLEGTTIFTAKPLPPIAQGCDEGATLGKREKYPQPRRGCLRLRNRGVRQPLRGCLFYYPVTQGSPRGLGQPWALRGNGFAV